MAGIAMKKRDVFYARLLVFVARQKAWKGLWRDEWLIPLHCDIIEQGLLSMATRMHRRVWPTKMKKWMSNPKTHLGWLEKLCRRFNEWLKRLRTFIRPKDRVFLSCPPVDDPSYYKSMMFLVKGLVQARDALSPSLPLPPSIPPMEISPSPVEAAVVSEVVPMEEDPRPTSDLESESDAKIDPVSHTLYLDIACDY